MYMSVVNGSFTQVGDSIASAQWDEARDNGAQAPLGIATLGQGAAQLGFLVTSGVLSGAGVLGCTAVSLPPTGWALRLDEVAFPVGAIAHRHTHSGGGWRHLVSGSLRIEAEHDTSVMNAGDSWFEPAHIPVRAVALQGLGVTRFVRCMVIPLADVDRKSVV